jgi:hypothetical protein
VSERDDLVGLHILFQREGAPALAMTVAMRRSVALTCIEQLVSMPGRARLDDVVGNPVVIDCDAVVNAYLVTLEAGPKLLSALQPIAPGTDLAALVPEALVRTEPAPKPQDGKPPTAADQDPIEAAMAGMQRMARQ